MVKVFTKNPVCQTDGNGIKPRSNLNTADKPVAEPSKLNVGASNNMYVVSE